MSDESEVLPGLDPEVRRRVVRVEVDTRNVSGMTHEANVHGFTFYSDEPPDMAGDDQHPYPLDYFAAAIGL